MACEIEVEPRESLLLQRPLDDSTNSSAILPLIVPLIDEPDPPEQDEQEEEQDEEEIEAVEND